MKVAILVSFFFCIALVYAQNENLNNARFVFGVSGPELYMLV
ncbi:MAG: hypothetical protein ABI691_19890 [Ginsengibacter sp.]